MLFTLNCPYIAHAERRIIVNIFPKTSIGNMVSNDTFRNDNTAVILGFQNCNLHELEFSHRPDYTYQV